MDVERKARLHRWEAMPKEELNAQIGLVLAGGGLPEPVRSSLLAIQNELFDVGADLSVPFGQVTQVIEHDADPKPVLKLLPQITEAINARKG